MKIGIYGGSFNPVHNNHKCICDYLINNHILDKIIIVPTGIHYEYKSNLISNEDRYNMLNLCFKDYSNISISDYELKDHIVYTIDTLKYYKELYKNDDIYFICGLDNFSYIDSWHNGMDYFKYNIIVINRDGYNIDKLLYKDKNKIKFINIELGNFSSTVIRDRIKNSVDVSLLLNKDVLKYIHEKNLYR